MTNQREQRTDAALAEVANQRDRRMTAALVTLANRLLTYSAREGLSLWHFGKFNNGQAATFILPDGSVAGLTKREAGYSFEFWRGDNADALLTPLSEMGGLPAALWSLEAGAEGVEFNLADVFEDVVVGIASLDAAADVRLARLENAIVAFTETYGEPSHSELPVGESLPEPVCSGESRSIDSPE